MAPRVPVYEREVERTTPTRAPATPLPSAPSGAFGGQLADATQNLGNAVQDAGTKMMNHVIELRAQERQKKLLDADTKLQAEMDARLYSADDDDDEPGKPRGYLNRTLDNAKGSLDSYRQWGTSKRDEFVASFEPGVEQERAESLFDRRAQDYERRIVEHEAVQMRQSQDASLNANLQVRAAAAANAKPDEVIDNFMGGADTLRERLQWKGTPDDVITVEVQKYALATAKSALANVERDPVGAQQRLNLMRPHLAADDFQALQGVVNSQLFEVKKQAIWQQARGYRLADGTFDTARAEKLVFGLDLTPKERVEAFGFVRSMGAVEDAQLRDQRAAADRAFTNTIIDQQKAGIPFADAYRLAGKSGYDEADALAKQKEVTDLYTNAANPFDKWLQKQDVATKLAWDDVEAYAKANFKSSATVTLPGTEEKVSARDAFMTEMKRAALGKTPDELRRILKEKTADRIQPNGRFFGLFDKNLGEGWQVDAAKRVENSEKLSCLEEVYGAAIVAEARRRLANAPRPIPATPDNLKALIDKLVSREAAQ